MRSGIDPQSIIKQLVGIRCNKPYGIGREKVVSCPDAIAKVLLEYTAIHSEMETMDLNLALETALESRPAFPCPDCGCELEVAEGCEKCHLCGYSRCG
jgi:ribonucleoside-diphosphate reductase alpha chain